MLTDESSDVTTLINDDAAEVNIMAQALSGNYNQSTEANKTEVLDNSSRNEATVKTSAQLTKKPSQGNLNKDSVLPNKESVPPNKDFIPPHKDSVPTNKESVPQNLAVPINKDFVPPRKDSIHPKIESVPTKTNVIDAKPDAKLSRRSSRELHSKHSLSEVETNKPLQSIKPNQLNRDQKASDERVNNNDDKRKDNHSFDKSVSQEKHPELQHSIPSSDKTKDNRSLDKTIPEKASESQPAKPSADKIKENHSLDKPTSDAQLRTRNGKDHKNYMKPIEDLKKPIPSSYDSKVQGDSDITALELHPSKPPRPPHRASTEQQSVKDQEHGSLPSRASTNNNGLCDLILYIF